MSEKIDRLDQKILHILSADCRTPIHRIGEQIGLSTSACHRRIRSLEERGVIDGYSAVINPKAIGRQMVAFVEISLAQQTEAVLSTFEQAVARAPEILECHLMSGQADYLIRIAVADPADYERVHRTCLTALPGVSRIHSSFALRQVQEFRGYVPAQTS